VSTEPFKSAFLIIVNSRRLVRGPSIALSIDQVFDQAENVIVLMSTLDMFYRARDPSVSALS